LKEKWVEVSRGRFESMKKKRDEAKAAGYRVEAMLAATFKELDKHDPLTKNAVITALRNVAPGAEVKTCCCVFLCVFALLCSAVWSVGFV
jgi:hypothetical protein